MRSTHAHAVLEIHKLGRQKGRLPRIPRRAQRICVSMHSHLDQYHILRPGSHLVASLDQLGSELHVLVVVLGEVLRSQGEQPRHEAYQVVHLFNEPGGLDTALRDALFAVDGRMIEK